MMASCRGRYRSMWRSLSWTARRPAKGVWQHRMGVTSAPGSIAEGSCQLANGEKRRVPMGQNDRVNVIAAVQTLPRWQLQFLRRHFPIGGNPEQGRDLHQKSLATHAGHGYLLHARTGLCP